MIIQATDFHLCESGLKTHQAIKIAKNGLCFPRQYDKERDIKVHIENNMCLICEGENLLHIITAPYRIEIINGYEPKIEKKQ